MFSPALFSSVLNRLVFPWVLSICMHSRLQWLLQVFCTCITVACFLWQCIQAFFFFLLSLEQAMAKRLCHHKIMKLSIRHLGETGTFSKVVICINYRTDSCFWESQPNSTMFPRFQSLTLFLAISLFLFQSSKVAKHGIGQGRGSFWSKNSKISSVYAEISISSSIRIRSGSIH